MAEDEGFGGTVTRLPRSSKVIAATLGLGAVVSGYFTVDQIVQGSVVGVVGCLATGVVSATRAAAVVRFGDEA